MDYPHRPIFWWIAGGLGILLLFGTQGFRQLFTTWREKIELDKALVGLRNDHERLTRELSWLQQDPAYTEYLIRKNLGYVKKGEVEYQFLQPKKGTNRHHPTDASETP